MTGRRAAKVDANQKEIVDGLRRLGFSVCSLASVGNGCPDLVVGVDDTNFLFEVKDGRKPPSQRKLTKKEEAFKAQWRGQLHVVECLEDAIAVIENALNLMLIHSASNPTKPYP